MKKYKIQACLDSFPDLQYRRVMNALPEVIGEDSDTIWEYGQIELGSKEDVPYAIVVKLEKFFQLQPGELSNEVIDVPSYSEAIKPPAMDSL